MKTTYYTKNIGLIFLILALTWLGCETDDPAVIFDPDDSGRPAPTITSVDPPNLGISVIGRITLNGQNFSPRAEENIVYFDEKQAVVESASATALTVVAPDLVTDSLRIRVFVNGAYESTEFFPYQLEPINKEYGGFDSSPVSETVNAIAVDRDGIVYAHIRARKVMKVIPPDTSHIEYATTSFNRAVEMRFGPGGYLYIQRKLTSSTLDDDLYRIPPGGGASELFLTYPARVGSFDFDQNLNIFGGALDSGFYAVDVNTTQITRTGKLLDFEIRSVRVYDGYVYAAAEYRGTDSTVAAQAIWRCEILSAAGDLGDAELFFDWTTTGDDTSGTVLETVTFSENGDMYIGTNNPNDGDPVLIVHPDGSFEPLYPGLLQYQSRQLVWGNDVILYENREGDVPAHRRLMRIITTSRGAPYYGRQ